MSRPITAVSGVILAGGQSKRFGKNKAFARLHGIPLIERVLQIMQSLFSDLLLVTNTPEEYQSLPITVLTDEIPYQGPLGGIITAFRHTDNQKIFVVACDMPILNTNEINKVIEAGDGHEAAIPLHGDTREYLMALYSRRLLDPMATALSKGQLSLKAFFEERQDVAWVPVNQRYCFNVNTQSDLAQLGDSDAL